MKTSRVVAALGLVLGVGSVLVIPAAGCTSTPEARRESALEDLHSYLRDGVKDPVRSRDALALLSEIDGLTGQVEKLRAGFQADIAALHRNHETEDAALLAMVEAFRKERAPLREQAIATRKRMRAVLTDDEWSGYARRELALMIGSRTQGGLR